LSWAWLETPLKGQVFLPCFLAMHVVCHLTKSPKFRMNAWPAHTDRGIAHGGAHQA